MAPRKKKKKTNDPKWKVGQTLRVIIPRDSEHYQEGLPCILIDTLEPVYIKNFTYLEFNGETSYAGNSMPTFTKVNDWNQKFLVPIELWTFLEKRKMNKRMM